MQLGEDDDPLVVLGGNQGWAEVEQGCMRDVEPGARGGEAELIPLGLRYLYLPAIPDLHCRGSFFRSLCDAVADAGWVQDVRGDVLNKKSRSCRIAQ